MKKTYNKLTCLFGHHDYSKELTVDKDGNSIRLCKICGQSGYRKYSGSLETWFDYDKEGNLVHEKWNDEDESWYTYNSKGHRVHEKYSDGDEFWKANNNRWIERKPKNWKHEKDLQ